MLSRNDVLERKSYGEALRNIVTSSSEALVICLDGQWGEGKTTFVKMWQGLLLKEKIPNIYIDAFANDYTDDPFISVASAIINYAEAHITEEHKVKSDELKQTAKKIGRQLLPLALGMAIRATTLGIITGSDLEKLANNIKNELSKEGSDAVDDFIEERINAHAKDIQLVRSFKTLLSELPSKLQGSRKRLVIIVDELDRCKPTFAVAMIEKIKHLFSVENVVFLLVMNKPQLEESIKSVYGQNLDAHTYLQKFINVETKLPKRTGEHSSDLNKYIKRLFELHELEILKNKEYTVDLMEILADHFNLSLRQLEKVFTNLVVFYAARADDGLRPYPIIVFLAMVKVIDPKLFDDLLHQRATYKEVSEKLNLPQFDADRERYRGLSDLIGWLGCCLLSEKDIKQLSEDDNISYFIEQCRCSRTSREEMIPFYAQKMNMFEVRR